MPRFGFASCRWLVSALVVALLLACSKEAAEQTPASAKRDTAAPVVIVPKEANPAPRGTEANPIPAPPPKYTPKPSDLPQGEPAYENLVNTRDFLVSRFWEKPDPGKETSHGYAMLDRKSGQAVLIDPGFLSIRIMQYWIEHEKAQVKAILATHGHIDHVGGVSILKQRFPQALFYVSAKDAKWMSAPSRYGFPAHKAPTPPAPDKTLNGGETLNFGALQLTVLATPGHTTGSLSFYWPKEKLLFSGDTLFRRAVGRVDLPNSLSLSEEVAGLKRAYAPLPDITAVYPGHGGPTTLGEEREQNPYLNAKGK